MPDPDDQLEPFDSVLQPGDVGWEDGKEKRISDLTEDQKRRLLAGESETPVFRKPIEGNDRAGRALDADGNGVLDVIEQAAQED